MSTCHTSSYLGYGAETPTPAIVGNGSEIEMQGRHANVEATLGYAQGRSSFATVPAVAPESLHENHPLVRGEQVVEGSCQRFLGHGVADNMA